MTIDVRLSEDQTRLDVSAKQPLVKPVLYVGGGDFPAIFGKTVELQMMDDKGTSYKSSPLPPFSKGEDRFSVLYRMIGNQEHQFTSSFQAENIHSGKPGSIAFHHYGGKVNYTVKFLKEYARQAPLKALRLVDKKLDFIESKYRIIDVQIFAAGREKLSLAAFEDSIYEEDEDKHYDRYFPFESKNHIEGKHFFVQFRAPEMFDGYMTVVFESAG